MTEADKARNMLYRLAMLMDDDKFSKWMITGNPGMRGLRPACMIFTEEGRGHLEQMIEQIKAGAFQ
jgi:hypothetical protein